MPDREKVIKGLKLCATGSECTGRDCPYWHNVLDDAIKGCDCTTELVRDALTLLKEDCHNCKLECLLQKYDELKEKYDALLKEQEAVVLCKDCNYYDGDENSGFGTCVKNGVCSTPDWFCADGESKECR